MNKKSKDKNSMFRTYKYGIKAKNNVSRSPIHLLISFQSPKAPEKQQTNVKVDLFSRFVINTMKNANKNYKRMKRMTK
jgi:hypothetical protein